AEVVNALPWAGMQHARVIATKHADATLFWYGRDGRLQATLYVPDEGGADPIVVAERSPGAGQDALIHWNRPPGQPPNGYLLDISSQETSSLKDGVEIPTQVRYRQGMPDKGISAFILPDGSVRTTSVRIRTDVDPVADAFDIVPVSPGVLWIRGRRHES